MTDHNLVDELLQEHVAIKNHFAEYRQDRDATLAELKKLLVHHTEVEEAVLYPVAKTFAEEETNHAIEEHNKADELLAQLEADPTNDQVFEELKAAVEHHIEEEEGEFFPKVRENVDPPRLDDMYHEAERLGNK